MPQIIRPDIVAIGASAGGVQAISLLMSRLPEDLPATVLVTLHRPTATSSNLPAILGRVAHMPVKEAEEGEPLEPGTCLVSPPDRHLTVTPGPRVHLLPDGFYRSHSIDALFNSPASCAGRRTIGVVLTGMLKDGTFGLKSIKEAGGIALVQDPAEAAYADMPSSAILQDGRIDLVGPIDALADDICRRMGRTPVSRLAVS